MLGTSLALPQRRPEQGDYRPSQPSQDQYQAPAVQQQQQQQYQENRNRESTTFIPIIRFDKEQGDDGSYKAA